MRRLIVTGSSGFIGTNVILSSVNNYEVFAIDKAPPKIYANKVNYITQDLSDFQSSRNIFDDIEPDLVLHLAARTDLLGSSLEEYGDNILVVRNICEIVSRLKAVQKIIFASSMLVCKVGHIPETSDEYSYTTFYGHSKAIGEQIVKEFSNSLPKHCVVRPTSIWGPYFGSPYRDFFSVVSSGRYFYFGSMCKRKTYGYVGNTVNQLLELLDNDTWNHASCFYLGDSESMTIDDFAKLIMKVGGCKETFRMPAIGIRLLAKLGDVLSNFGLQFPMSSFRLSNIATENIILDLEVERMSTREKVEVIDGIRATIHWINQQSEVNND